MISEDYTFIREIGKGTYSTIFLAKDRSGVEVAIKQYEITDPSIRALLEESETTCEAYVKNIAERELELGKLTNHPNILNIRNAYFEGEKSYVVMDYINGQSLDLIQDFESYPEEARMELVKQLLSAVAHLLSHNIIVDDLWTGNIMITGTSQLTLIDLGGNEKDLENIDLPVSHYLELIERMLCTLGGSPIRPILDRCNFILSEDLRSETMRPTHIEPLLSFIKEIERELSGPEPALARRSLKM